MEGYKLLDIALQNLLPSWRSSAAARAGGPGRACCSMAATTVLAALGAPGFG